MHFFAGLHRHELFFLKTKVNSSEIVCHVIFLCQATLSSEVCHVISLCQATLSLEVRTIYVHTKFAAQTCDKLHPRITKNVKGNITTTWIMWHELPSTRWWNITTLQRMLHSMQAKCKRKNSRRWNATRNEDEKLFTWFRTTLPRTVLSNSKKRQSFIFHTVRIRKCRKRYRNTNWL